MSETHRSVAGRFSKPFGLLVAFALQAVLLTGCQTLGIPAHPRSLDIDGEEISVRFLKLEAMKPYEADWKAAFGDGTPLEALQVVDKQADPTGERAFGAVLSVLIPMAADFVTEKLDEEATRYEAQYEASQTVDDFWLRSEAVKPATWTQQYLGVELTRKTTSQSPAVHMVLGLAKVAEQDRLKVAPLHVSVNSVKAKVLDTTPWSFLPPLWWQFLLEAGHEVEVSLELKSTTGAVDDRAGLVESSSAPKSVKFPAFDLDTPKAWSARDHEGSVSVMGTLPLPMISTPARYKLQVKAAGVLELGLVVVERDPSNARKYLTKLSKTVSEQAAKLVEKYSKDDDGVGSTGTGTGGHGTGGDAGHGGAGTGDDDKIPTTGGKPATGNPPK